jgi:sugar phosphate permease
MMSRPIEQDHPVSLSRSRVLVVMGSYFLLTGVLQALVALRASSLGANGAVLGLLLALAGGGIGLVTDLGFAAYGDAHGREKVVFFGFVCGLVAVVIMASDGSLPALFLGCFLVGLGSSAVFDCLLALLTTTPHRHSQTRTQGFNVTTQRAGALLAALLIGWTLSSRHDEILALAGVGACLAPLLVIGPKATLSRGGGDRALATRRLLTKGYRLGLEMLHRRRIVMAALISVAVNLIFIETNSFVPLLDHRAGVRQAVIITAALATRDLVAIAVGVFTVATGKDASSPKVVVGVLCLAATSAVGIGLQADGSHVALIIFCGLQGVAIGVGIAAMNLLTVGASGEAQRAVAMAAATLVNRVGVIVIPIALGLTLELAGLKCVFFVIGGTLLAFSLACSTSGVTRQGRPPPPENTGRVV